MYRVVYKLQKLSEQLNGDRNSLALPFPSPERSQLLPTREAGIFAHQRAAARPNRRFRRELCFAQQQVVRNAARSIREKRRTRRSARKRSRGRREPVRRRVIIINKRPREIREEARDPLARRALSRDVQFVCEGRGPRASP